MRRYLLRGGIILAAIFILCNKSNAQIIELACPLGSTSVQSLQTINTNTGKLRQNYCVDPSGNVFQNISNGLTSSGAVTMTPLAICTIANSPTGATESGSTVTIVTTASCPITNGQYVAIDSVGVSTYDGVYQVSNLSGNNLSFQYTSYTSGFAASGGGTVTPLFSYTGYQTHFIPTVSAFGANQGFIEGISYAQGSCNIQAEHARFGTGAGSGSEDAIALCVNVPNTNATPNVQGFTSFMINNSVGGGAIGSSFNSRCVAANSLCWSDVTAVIDTAATTVQQLTGQEIDINILGTPNAVNGSYVIGSFQTQPTSAIGYLVDPPNLTLPGFGAGTGKWTTGFSVADGSTTGTAVSIGLLNSGNSQGSANLNFNSKDAGGTVHTTTINTDLSNDLLFNTRAFVMNGTAVLVSQGTKPTLTGTGACATFGTQAGGAFAGSSSCASATAASTLTITFAVNVGNGYICNVYDETTRANLFQQTSHTTTSCTLTATSITQNDVFVYSAIGF